MLIDEEINTEKNKVPILTKKFNFIMLFPLKFEAASKGDFIIIFVAFI